MKIDVMIPAYDEFLNLSSLIPKIRDLIDVQKYGELRLHVIHRFDETEEEIEKLKKLQVNLIRRLPSNSFGDAIRSGVKSIPVDSALTIFMDADGSHNPSTIPRLIEIMHDQNIDVGIASRYIKGGSTDNNLILKIMSRVLNSVFGAVLGIQAKDVSTNFKIYRSHQLSKIELRCDKFDILEEVLIRLRQQKKNEFTIQEIPDHFHNRVHGESKRRLGPFIVGYIFTLIRLRFIRN